MSKYIDADALRKRMEQIAEESKPVATARPMREDTPSELLRYGTARAMIEYLDEIPAADVEPVRHGKWVPGKEISRTLLGDETLAVEYSDFRCSSCGRRYKEYVLIYRYCPNCGAKMDKEEGHA